MPLFAPPPASPTTAGPRTPPSPISRTDLAEPVPLALASVALAVACGRSGPVGAQNLLGIGSGGDALGQLADVVAHDQLAVGFGELVQLGHVVERVGHALDVRPVAAEQHPVGAHDRCDLVRVVLPE